MSKSKTKSAAKSVPKAKTEKRSAPKVETAPVVEPTVATVDAPAVDAPASKAKKSKPAVTTVEQNGIKRPAADTLCGRVWQVLDDLRTAGVDATAKNAAAAFDGVAISPATIRTQTQRFKSFHGIKRAAPAVASEETQQPAA